MKVKVVSNYDSDENMYKSCLNCFENDTDLQLVFGDSYDKMVVINGYQGKINCTRDDVVGILQEPIGNINYDRNLHFYCSKILCQSSSMFRGYSGIEENFLPMFYRHHEAVNKEYFIDFKDFSNRKKLCLIVSSIAYPNNPNWQNHNYRKRHILVNNLLRSNLDFDFYGNGWTGIDDSRYKGPCQDKHETLRKYEYTIAIENVCEKNYASEKLIDCFLNNTVPLYYGCPNVSELFDKQSFINIDITDPNITTVIKDKISTKSIKYRNNILKSKNAYFTKLNIFRAIERLIK